MIAILRRIFALRPGIGEAHVDHAQFVEANPAVENFLLARRRVETPPAALADDRNGEWPFVFSQHQRCAVRALDCDPVRLGIQSHEVFESLPVSNGIAGTHEGRWNANLDENPSVLAPEIVPFLTDAMHVVFGACADLRTVREFVSQGCNGPLWTSEPWQQIAIIDAALRDWRHLAGFIRSTNLPFSASKDMNLIKGIQKAFTGIP